MQRCSLALSLLLWLPACGGDDGDSSTSDGGTATDSGTTGSGGTTGSSDGTTSEGSGSTSGGSTGGGSTGGGSSGGVTDSSGTTDGPPTEPPPATGIQIVDVTADQAVRVPIAIDGQLVQGNARNLPLLKDRNTLIRAFYEVDAGYETRDIFATLTLSTGGETHEYTSFQTVGEDPECAGQPQYECRYRSLINSFNFMVPGENIQPDSAYSISMVETAPGHENDVSDKIPIFPTDGSEMIVGVEDTYMKMRVVVVPFDHDVGAECPDPPDLNAPWTGQDGDESNAWFFGRKLIAHNPADEVEIVVHDTVKWTGSASDSGPLLNRLQQLRSSDGADPGWYYYGVIRPCNGGPSFSGVAQLGGPSTWEASSRVGWGVWHNSVSSTANTFVHEIGHEQGRSHIRCTGDEAGADSSYPDHPEGDLVDEYGKGNYGTDVYSPQIDVHTPDDHDYMTYCGSSWVSEWGYDKVLPWIEEISSWENGDAVPPPGELLHGYIHEDGTTEWWVGQGWWDPSQATGGNSIESVDGGQIVSTPAMVREYERSNERYVIAPVPVGFHASTTDLTWNDGTQSHPILRSQIDLKLPIKTK